MHLFRAMMDTGYDNPRGNGEARRALVLPTENNGRFLAAAGIEEVVVFDAVQILHGGVVPVGFESPIM